ncbi:MAG TPA: DUF2341 domain-containing protein, partial [Gemmataceae bacterium]|nr:DUF2341 domain-containing protein [Gemmataceae bacterium]
MKSLRFAIALLCAFGLGARADAQTAFADWKHSGSIYVLTDAEGADLPASVNVENFPLLVRLHKDFFPFDQAKANGDDLRFADGNGAPLAHQIEEWNPARGAACVWVRIPSIRGNARQEIKLFWGNSAAPRVSDGKAVFNASNGYVSVRHMSDPVRDEVTVTTSVDQGTTRAAGIIGAARHFDLGHGIRCGEDLLMFPSGSAPNTSEAWIRADKSNGRILAWGLEKAQGKVVMQVSSPPHIRMECYFSGADVAGKSKLPMSEWTHIAHTYKKGESRVYVNGRLDGVNVTPNAPLSIPTPAKMWIGGWYGTYNFVGDIDEVRISS